MMWGLHKNDGGHQLSFFQKWIAGLPDQERPEKILERQYRESKLIPVSFYLTSSTNNMAIKAEVISFILTLSNPL
ncbi:MAG: hypothetical protein A2W75_06860 [Nitrospinae bacterium RIFCSPLOWO2_12_39_15]|nr:MAG: hypothetical protein A2W75_06860 [Nitrospinae bacterium RIFCSPLOWO2_12_39_15]